MKKLLLPLLGLAALATPAFADEVIPAAQLPDTAKKNLEAYFPAAEFVEVKKDEGDKDSTYEIKLKYKDLLLEVDVSEDGKVTDVDLLKP